MLYRRLLTLFTIVIKKHKHVVIKEVLMFAGLHHEYINQVLMLTTCCMDLQGLDLMIVALIFIYELIKYKEYVSLWRIEDMNSFNNIMVI